MHDEFPATENGEVGNGLDLVKLGQVGVRFGVYFQDQGAAGHFLGERFNFGRRHAARPAPGGPEIDEDRHFGFLHDLHEIGTVSLDRLGRGFEGSFTGAAASGVGQVRGGNAIVGATGRATG